MNTMGGSSLKHLSDEALLAKVSRMTRAHRVLTAELVAHLAEMDARKLYLRQATPSMFVYCVRRLGFSEDEACRRIDAARLVRKWPIILGKIASGQVSLTVLGRLKPFLQDANAAELLEAASGMSVREVEHMLAARFPKPDVPDSIRKLPGPKVENPDVIRASGGASMESAGAANVGSGSMSSGNMSEARVSSGVGAPTSVERAMVNPLVLRAAPVSSDAVTRSAATVCSTAAGPTVPTDDPASSSPNLRMTDLGTQCSGDESRSSRAGRTESERAVDRGKMQPLSADRIQVKFTASRSLGEKLEQARDLMSHGNPRGDLATIIEAALDLLIADRRKKKLGQTNRKLKKARPAKRAHVTSAARREVLDRDGLGCSFVDGEGRRCGARAFLEFDHRKPKGTGGGSEAENVRLLCRAHNQLEAERVYGRAHMERCRQKKTELKVREGGAVGGYAVGIARADRIPHSRKSPALTRTQCELSGLHPALVLDGTARCLA